jgi:hypothetical protein
MEVRMQYASNLQHPRRSLAVLSSAAAVLGAAVATATFALVNIEDEPVVSLQTPAAVSANVPSVPSDTNAGSVAVGIPSPAAAAKMYGPVACGTDAVGIPSPAAAARMNEDCGSGGAP